MAQQMSTQQVHGLVSLMALRTDSLVLQSLQFPFQMLQFRLQGAVLLGEFLVGAEELGQDGLGGRLHSLAVWDLV